MMTEGTATIEGIEVGIGETDVTIGIEGAIGEEIGETIGIEGMTEGTGGTIAIGGMIEEMMEGMVAHRLMKGQQQLNINPQTINGTVCH